MKKSIEMWDNSHRNFDDFVSVGDEVEREIVEYFLGAVPPTINRPGFVQDGEPSCHRCDKTGNCKPKFITFLQKNGKWFYMGKCFEGEFEGGTV